MFSKYLTLLIEILLGKLEHYGIRGLPLICFKCYLSNRKQTAKLDSVSQTFKLSLVESHREVY